MPRGKLISKLAPAESCAAKFLRGWFDYFKQFQIPDKSTPFPHLALVAPAVRWLVADRHLRLRQKNVAKQDKLEHLWYFFLGILTEQWRSKKKIAQTRVFPADSEKLDPLRAFGPHN